MPMVAEVVDAVVGGDTHKHTHTLEMLSPVGARLAGLQIDNDEAGFAAAAAWIVEHAPGPRVIVGLEGTRSYGIGLSRALQAAGLVVVEVERPKRTQRHGRGKSDPIDAHLAAVQVLGMRTDRLPIPRADGDREALRILLVARHEMTNTQTRCRNQLKALLHTGDEFERSMSSGHLNQARLTTIIRRRGTDTESRLQTIRREEARRLAQTVRDIARELTANHKQLRQLVASIAPDLLAKRGIGPVSAAQAIISWSHRGRCRNEAAFAKLAGAPPIPASSGKTVRHRLNRGGDRQLNAALHTIAMTRWRSCPRTADYIDRRRAQGKTDREIRRVLKRYIAREIYRTLNAAPAA
ncbi:MAG: IS110 family transposase [Mycobacterium sp.]|nr:IS110 family transposase [Mycobacterium sp.]